jgi:hypothetical protein
MAAIFFIGCGLLIGPPLSAKQMKMLLLSQGVVTRSLTNPALLLTAYNAVLNFGGCRAGNHSFSS